METTEQLIEKLLKLLNEHKVKYVIVGAAAIPLYVQLMSEILI